MKPLTAILIAACALLLLAGPAGAQEQRPPDGEFVTQSLGSFPIDPDTTCTVTTANNISVHPGNVLGIRWDGNTRYRDGVEDEADQSVTITFDTGGATTVDAFVLVNQTVPFPFTSLTVTVDCDTPPTTPTTPPPTVPTTPTTHPPTGGTEPSTIWYGLAGALAAAGVTLPATRRATRR